MEQSYLDGNERLKPNVVVINCVMNACAYTHGDLQEQSRAMEIAHTVLKKLEKNPEFGKTSLCQEDVILRIQSLAETYYQSIWNSLTKSEKYLIFDLATRGRLKELFPQGWREPPVPPGESTGMNQELPGQGNEARPGSCG